MDTVEQLIWSRAFLQFQSGETPFILLWVTHNPSHFLLGHSHARRRPHSFHAIKGLAPIHPSNMKRSLHFFCMYF
jgi:hypothetical protein